MKVVRIRTLWHYRELLYSLVARDLKVRYKSSVLGFLWCLINPLLMMAVFTLVFTILLGNRSIENFPVFVLIGVLAWNLNTTAVMGALGSVVNNANLVMKVSFPRELLPLSAVLSNTVNFLLSLVALLSMMVVFRMGITPWVLLFPVVLLSQVCFMGGLGLAFSAIHVYLRDTGIIMETLLLAWFFLTPVFYRMEDLFPAYARWMYWLNPMASYISSYRLIFYSGDALGLDFLLRSLVTSVAVLLAGYLVFTRLSKGFGEVL